MSHDSRYETQCPKHGWYFYEDGCAVAGCENSPRVGASLPGAALSSPFLDAFREKLAQGDPITHDEIAQLLSAHDSLLEAYHSVAALEAGPPSLTDDDVYRLNDTVWRDNPAESIAEAKRRLAVAGGEAGPSPAGLTPIQELAQAAQNYLSAEAHVGVTHEMLRELNHRLGSLAGPHLVAYEAIAPRDSGNAVDFGVRGPPQEKPSAT